jgi:VanZ family protein
MVVIIAALLVCIIGMTRFFSGQNGSQSHQESKSVVDHIARYLIDNDIPVNRNDVFWTTSADKIIRKIAHFIMFMMVGTLLSILLNIFIKKIWLTFPISLVISIILAYLDEYRQQFVIGRTPEWGDVRIDSYGAVVGIIVASLCFLAINRISELKETIRMLEQKSM